jgi:hypothetical protein
MKRFGTSLVVALACVLVAGLPSAYAQTASKVPSEASFQISFPFQAGGKKLTLGAYALRKAPDGGLVLRQVSNGKETAVPVLERIPKPVPPVSEARLVFDEVGDFAPSYTEYLTVYVLSEVWLPGEDGYRVHTTKGAHKTKVVRAGAVLPLSEPH